MTQNTMLYKHGGKHKIHGDNFSYIIVDADEDGKITRDELEGKAIELEIPFRSNTKDETILKAINEKLGENDE